MRTLISAVFCISVSVSAQEITLGTSPTPTPINKPGLRVPETWAEVLATVSPRRAAPGASELESCRALVTTPDSLFLTSNATLHASVWIETADGASWASLAPAKLRPDTLPLRVLNLDCRSVFSQPFAVVLGGDGFFLKVTAAALLREGSSITELETAPVLIRGKAGAREPAKLVMTLCDTCAYRITTDQPRFDSLSQRFALTRARVEAERRTARSSGQLQAAAAQQELQDAEERRVVRVRARKWPPAVTTAVLARKIAFGMTREQVRLSWGEPEDINRTVTPGRVREQWVYGEQLVYFVNGVVTAWQD